MIDDVKPVKKKSSSPLKILPTSISKGVPMPEDEPKLKLQHKPAPLDATPSIKPKKHRFKSWKARLKALTWKEWLVIGAISVVVIGGCVVSFLAIHHKPASQPVVAKTEPTKPTTKPTTEPSKLTGNMVPIDYNKLPVTGVMIENSPDARPQSGLRDAGVIFEAVAEGGITRFLALFQDPSVPNYLGPVRSVRPYYLDYLGGFDAAIAHVGGSANGQAEIRQGGIKDLDQEYNSSYYHRISSRYAPHNVYTSVAELLALQKAKGYSSNYVGFKRKAKDTPSSNPTARSIDFTISGYFYNVHYDYDSTTNLYKRSEGGKPHTDERSGAQLSPKVVIAIVVPESPDPDGVHTLYNPYGNGKAYIFQDGVVTVGAWDKPGRPNQIQFKDANGSDFALNPGQTWITLVGTAGSVSYKP